MARRTFVLLPLVLAGCSGDLPSPPDEIVSSPGGIPGLSGGAYVFSNARVDPDGCNLGESWHAYPDATVNASASGLRIVFPDGFVLAYELEGTTLVDPSFPAEFVEDFSDEVVAREAGLSRAYDCRVTYTFDGGGAITDVDAFTLRDTFAISASGDGCGALANEWGAETLEALYGVESLPCTSIDSVDATLAL